MCGVYHIDNKTVKEIQEIVHEITCKLNQTGDIYPSQSAIVITGRKHKLIAEVMKWGFPHFQGKGLHINARAETVLEKRTFRNSALYHRCVIPACHFYEWDMSKNKATFYREDNSSLFFAGIYNSFEGENRFIILTTEANDSVIKVHDRMPLILERDEIEDWIFDEQFIEFARRKKSPMLDKFQEYEQQVLVFE